ncbi:MAG: metallophosphoesterase [Methanothrix sp.]|jgi:exonuclease SbcD|nr:metallophosphoesterase [Methanothrix sp.]
MFRGIHISDIHLGLTTYGSMNEKHRINTRSLEGLELLDFVINEANNNADVLFISGDIYETPNPTNRIRAEFEKRLVYCNKIGLPIVFIPGNHCIPKSDGSSHPFVSDRVYSLPNIFMMDDVGIQTITVKNGEIINVLALPHMYSKDWGKYGSNSSKAVSNIIKKIEIEGNNIIIGHLTVSGAINNYEKTDVFSEEFTVPKEVFQSSNKFAVVLLGHIHQHLKIDENIWYSGSLFPNTFGEEADRKGYVYFEVDNNKLTNYEFKEFKNYTRFKTISIIIDKEDKNPTDVIVKSIINTKVKDCIIRLDYSLTEEQLLHIDINKIKGYLEESKYFDITRHIIDDTSNNTTKTIEKSINPIDAVSEYCYIKGSKFKENNVKLIEITNKLLDLVNIDNENKIQAISE